MLLKNKVINRVVAATLSALALIVPATSAFAVSYNGTTVPPQADGITYNITANSGDSLTLSNVGQGNGQIALTFKNNVNGTIVIKTSTSAPASVSSAPTGSVATYYDVTLNSLTNADISASTWSFSTPKTFLSNIGLASTNIFLEHFNGTGWDRLNTKLVSTDTNNFNYSATVTSFSPFAVVAVPGLANTGTPYAMLLGGGATVLAIIGLVYFLSRKRSIQKHIS